MGLWVRFRDADRERFGALEGEMVTPFRGDMFGDHRPDGAARSLADLELLAPCTPGLFIGLWNNFHAVAAKQGHPEPDEPLYFLKARHSLLAPGGVIRRPASFSGRMIYEGELGVVIGKTCRNVDEAAAEQSIFGYTCVNDVTALDWISSPANFPQWTRAKSCDTFGPVGPAIATGLDWSSLRVRSLLNGRERQNYPANDMILPPARIISLLSREITLGPGDLIACGTSVGALPLRPGDRIEIEIEGVGTLSNLVQDEAAT